GCTNKELGLREQFVAGGRRGHPYSRHVCSTDIACSRSHSDYLTFRGRFIDKKGLPRLLSQRRWSLSAGPSSCSVAAAGFLPGRDVQLNVVRPLLREYAHLDLAFGRLDQPLVRENLHPYVVGKSLHPGSLLSALPRVLLFDIA